jgi:hypothetical protein
VDSILNQSVWYVQPKLQPRRASQDPQAGVKQTTNDENRDPKLPKAKKARKQKDSGPEKGDSSQAIGFDDLLALTMEEHDIIERSFEKTKSKPPFHFPFVNTSNTTHNDFQNFPYSFWWPGSPRSLDLSA